VVHLCLAGGGLGGPAGPALCGTTPCAPRPAADHHWHRVARPSPFPLAVVVSHRHRLPHPHTRISRHPALPLRRRPCAVHGEASFWLRKPAWFLASREVPGVPIVPLIPQNHGARHSGYCQLRQHRAIVGSQRPPPASRVGYPDRAIPTPSLRWLSALTRTPWPPPVAELAEPRRRRVPAVTGAAIGVETVANVEGARIPPKIPGNAPCRITPRSSIESALATLPATIEVIFAPAFAPVLPALTGSRTRC
jgi:hypothetical protein